MAESIKIALFLDAKIKEYQPVDEIMPSDTPRIFVTAQDVCRNPENTNTIIYVCKDNTIESANDIYFDTSKAPTYTESPRDCNCSISVIHYSRYVVTTRANVSFVEPSQLGTLSFQTFDGVSLYTFVAFDDGKQVFLPIQRHLVITYRSTASHTTSKACLHIIATHNDTRMKVTCISKIHDTITSSKPSMSTPASDTTPSSDTHQLVDTDTTNRQEVQIEEEESLSVGLVIGIVAAAVVTTISVFVIIYCYKKRRKTNDERSKGTTEYPRKDKAHLNKVPPSTIDKDKSAAFPTGYYNIEQNGSEKHEGNVMIVTKSDENNSICQVNAEPEKYENTKSRSNIHVPHCNTDFAVPNYENDSLRSLENNDESTDKATKPNACGTRNVYLNMPTTDYENTKCKLSQVPARNPGISEPGVYEQLEASPYQNTDRTEDDREYTQLHV